LYYFSRNNHQSLLEKSVYLISDGGKVTALIVKKKLPRIGAVSQLTIINFSSNNNFVCTDIQRVVLNSVQ